MAEKYKVVAEGRYTILVVRTGVNIDPEESYLVCECFDLKTAELIAGALNKLEGSHD